MSDPFIYPDEIKALNALDLPDDAMIFDIGCSYGEYTFEVAKKMNGRPFKAHCFEPNLKLGREIMKKLEPFPNCNYAIIHVAVSDKNGHASFIRVEAPGNQAAEGCSTLYDRQCFKDNPAWKSALRKETVETITLDSHIADWAVKHIDLMKIDVEGAEMSVFKGARQMFQDGLVDVIQFEYNDSWKDAGTTMAQLREFIKPYNYHLADFKDGKFIELTDFVEDYGFHNYYLIYES